MCAVGAYCLAYYESSQPCKWKQMVRLMYTQVRSIVIVRIEKEKGEPLFEKKIERVNNDLM